MQKDKTQLQRLVFIDQKIREGMRRGMYANCGSMASEYEVSRKTIQRDMDYLINQRDAPIAYDSTKRGYYYTEENYSLPAIEISTSDLFAICVTEKVLRQHRNTPVYGKLQSVFKKIQDSLPDKVSFHPAWAASNISVIGEQQTVIDQEVWTTVADCLQKSKRLKIAYKKPLATKGEERQVDPYHIVSFQGEWYLIGYCHLRQTVLTFAISRIQQAVADRADFTIPEDFDYEEIANRRFGIFGGQETHRVTILFNKRTAPFIKEREWHPSQEIREHKDGSLEMSVSASHFLEIKRWVLSWGRGARVLEPVELQDELARELREMVESYS